MRVLMATWGWRSHFYPLVPLGWALAAAGHQVRVACRPGVVDAVTGAGLTAVPVGVDLDFAAVFSGRIGPVAPRDAGQEGARPAGGRLRPEITPDGGVVRYADAMLDELVAYARAWRPDLVVYEPFNLAAAVTAAALRVPGVRHLWGPDSGSTLDLDVEAVVGPLAARLGVPVERVELDGALTVDPCPTPMQVPLHVPSRPVRFVPYNGVSVVPAWLRDNGGPGGRRRDRVCVTWGTMMDGAELTGFLGAAEVVAALAELDLEVVVALDAAGRARFGEPPPNIRLAASPLALHLVLPTCRALVHQGGAGTTMTAAAAGLPQLVLPQVSDQHFNAARLAATGAGSYLDGATATGPAIRDRTLDLLGSAGWADAARRLSAAVEDRPTPADLVPTLVRLAAGSLHAAPVATPDPVPVRVAVAAPDPVPAPVTVTVTGFPAGTTETTTAEPQGR
ncbi:nucleotide disphospho-sugar-binding domain-containing protein [Micromonospora sp. NPDC050397]|uniref:nucleotide disphospho-sugar-binding domain-containing protein n=1 Tax=Micromonospora sp. NPDC050397 TaxID=3364279 RepID=UPI00384A766F